MRRRREDRLVEHILPVAGELLLGDDARGHRVLAPAGAGHHHALADLGILGAAERQGRQIEASQRLQQAEAGLLVEGQHVAGNDASAAVADPDGLGLGDQIADGEHQAVVADDDAVPRPLGAQRLGGEGVGGDDRLDADDRGQRLVEIVIVVVRLRLHGCQISRDANASKFDRA